MNKRLMKKLGPQEDTNSEEFNSDKYDLNPQKCRRIQPSRKVKSKVVSDNESDLKKTRVEIRILIKTILVEF